MRAIPIVLATVLATGCGPDRNGPVVERHGGEVRLAVVPAYAAAGTIPDHFLVNDTEVTVEYGHSFVLEHRTEDGWRPARGLGPSNCGFTAEALHLDPTERSAPAPVVACARPGDGLPPGDYRVVKDFDFVHSDYVHDREVLSATFVVR